MSKGRKAANILNKKFGTITVIKRIYDDTRKNSKWLCKCDCGQERIRPASTIKRLTACASCAQKLVKPNKSGSDLKEYDCWRQMLRRCFDRRNPGFKYYGERGITVSLEWQKSFWAFFKDMGPCPEKYSIERKNNSEGYFRENCKWVPKKEQARNRRSNKHITIEGVTRILTDWLIHKNISKEVYYGRLRMGWSVEKALLTSIKHKKHKKFSNENT